MPEGRGDTIFRAAQTLQRALGSTVSNFVTMAPP